MAAPVALPPSDGERHHLPRRRARRDLRGGMYAKPPQMSECLHFYAHPCNYHFYAHAPPPPGDDELGRLHVVFLTLHCVLPTTTSCVRVPSFAPFNGLQPLAGDPKSND